MTSPRPLLLLLPLALGLVQPAAAKQRPFAKVDLDGDGFIDPAEFAGKAKGKAWTKAVVDFAKRDADGDALLSPAEYDPSKAAGEGIAVPPVDAEALPSLWTKEIRLIWSNGIATKGEIKSFNGLLKKATPAQRPALQSYWDAEKAAAIDGGNQGSGTGGSSGVVTGTAGSGGVVEVIGGDRELPVGWVHDIVNGWAQEDPGAAAGWIHSVGGQPPVRPEPPRRGGEP